MLTSRISGEELEDLKQKASDHFWPHSKQTENMFGDAGVIILRRTPGARIFKKLENVENVIKHVLIIIFSTKGHREPSI